MLPHVSFIEIKMVPDFMEAAQKFKRLQDPERLNLSCGVYVGSRELL